MMSMRHRHLAIAIFAAAWILSTGAVRAEEVPVSNDTRYFENQTIRIEAPEPRINLPGLKLTDTETILKNRRMDAEYRTILTIPFLAEYIAAAYKYAVAIASILAVVMIIVSGFLWTASGGNTDTITKAKTRIIGAVTGLIIALGSYTLLYTINPELVQFRSLELIYLDERSITDVEGEPDYAGLGGSAGITVSPQDFVLSASCDDKKFATAVGSGDTFGRGLGQCLGWVKAAVQNACGDIPKALAKGGAWDAAASFQSAGRFHPCDLAGGIKDGDIVFMTSISSNYIGLWGNFRDGPNGCTIADALPDGQSKRYEKGQSQPFRAVEGAPRGMPPVTHIGIFYKGKIYHLTKQVHADDASSVQKRQNMTWTKRPNWNGIKLNGNFVKTTFIAGWGSLN